MIIIILLFSSILNAAPVFSLYSNDKKLGIMVTLVIFLYTKYLNNWSNQKEKKDIMVIYNINFSPF